MRSRPTDSKRESKSDESARSSDTLSTANARTGKVGTAGVVVQRNTSSRSQSSRGASHDSDSDVVPDNIDLWNERSVHRSRLNAYRDGLDEDDANVPESVRKVVSSTGHSLDTAVQRTMESRMGEDFSDVQVHTGPRAAKAAEDIDAKAFTVGNHVAFNRGEYDPSSQEGQHVIAHELAHVRQQTDGAVSMLPQDDVELEIDPDPELEQEAEETAQRVMKGGKLDIQCMREMDVHVQRMHSEGGPGLTVGAAPIESIERSGQNSRISSRPQQSATGRQRLPQRGILSQDPPLQPGRRPPTSGPSAPRPSTSRPLTNQESRTAQGAPSDRFKTDPWALRDQARVRKEQENREKQRLEEEKAREKEKNREWWKIAEKRLGGEDGVPGVAEEAPKACWLAAIQAGLVVEGKDTTGLIQVLKRYGEKEYTNDHFEEAIDNAEISSTGTEREIRRAARKLVKDDISSILTQEQQKGSKKDGTEKTLGELALAYMKLMEDLGVEEASSRRNPNQLRKLEAGRIVARNLIKIAAGKNEGIKNIAKKGWKGAEVDEDEGVDDGNEASSNDAYTKIYASNLTYVKNRFKGIVRQRGLPLLIAVNSWVYHDNTNHMPNGSWHMLYVYAFDEEKERVGYREGQGPDNEPKTLSLDKFMRTLNTEKKHKHWEGNWKKGSGTWKISTFDVNSKYKPGLVPDTPGQLPREL